MNKNVRRLAAALALWLGAAGAQAQVNIVKVGVTRYTTDSVSTGIKGIGVPPGADAETGDATTAIFTYERMFTPNIGVEFAVGIPPRVHADATGSVAFLGSDVLSAKNASPTLFINYHFGNPGDTWRPSLGIGAQYTRFVGIRSKLSNDVRMDDTLGPAAVAGLDYAINKQWGLFASVAVLRVRTDLVAVASNVLTTTIDFRPVTYSFGASFRF